MPKFDVMFTLAGMVTVEAENRYEADDIVSNMPNIESHLLQHDNFDIVYIEENKAEE